MTPHPADLATDPPPASTPASRGRELPVLLAKALRLAGEAGRPVAASELAGQAWWALREVDPAGAERINGVMHYLAQLPEEPDEPTP